MLIAMGVTLKDLVFEAEEVLICPYAEAPVLGEAITADARSREDHVAVSRPDLDRVNDLDEVDSVRLRKKAPFMEE